MILTTAHIVLLAFGFGLIAGSLTAYFVMRWSLKKNIKSFSRTVHVIKSQKDSKDNDHHYRKENLVLLADKLRQIETNLKRIRDKELNNHISGLNNLLNDIGISKIESED